LAGVGLHQIALHFQTKNILNCRFSVVLYIFGFKSVRQQTRVLAILPFLDFKRENDRNSILKNVVVF